MGNVVLTNDWHDGIQEKLDEFSAYFGISENDMERGWQAAWPAYRVGKINEGDFWRRFLVAAGAKKIDVEKCKELCRKYQKPFKETLDLLRRLCKNYQLAIISNIGKEWLEFKTKKFHLNDYFELIVASCLEGVAKPDPEIFKVLIKKVSVLPKEILFVDDQEKSIGPARSLGINAVLFKNVAQLKKDLSRFGVKID